MHFISYKLTENNPIKATIVELDYNKQIDFNITNGIFIEFDLMHLNNNHLVNNYGDYIPYIYYQTNNSNYHDHTNGYISTNNKYSIYLIDKIYCQIYYSYDRCDMYIAFKTFFSYLQKEDKIIHILKLDSKSDKEVDKSILNNGNKKFGNMFRLFLSCNYTREYLTITNIGDVGDKFYMPFKSMISHLTYMDGLYNDQNCLKSIYKDLQTYATKALKHKIHNNDYEDFMNTVKRNALSNMLSIADDEYIKFNGIENYYTDYEMTKSIYTI